MSTNKYFGLSVKMLDKYNLLTNVEDEKERLEVAIEHLDKVKEKVDDGPVLYREKGEDYRIGYQTDVKGVIKWCKCDEEGYIRQFVSSNEVLNWYLNDKLMIWVLCSMYDYNFENE